MTVKILKIVGFRKSGKTALIEALSGEFVKREFRVAALKTTSHEHDFDRTSMISTVPEQIPGGIVRRVANRRRWFLRENLFVMPGGSLISKD
jgi:molybdopterin-guanine dinucleotide biosynthesis protein